MSLPMCTTAEWTMSRYPPGYRFAFTIVHDADTAYSERLSPLFDVFDQLGLRLTVTVFTAWADWARDGAIWKKWRSAPEGEQLFAPKSVPLCDPAEQRFYRQLAERGHEIGLHSPSETSDSRQQLLSAFEYFRQVFGHHPAVYVEHSAPNNKEALANEGADPASAYYCADLLHQYGPWLWIDDESSLPRRGEQYYAIPADRSPFNALVAQRYGAGKAFVRTGKWGEADGDGFLEWYSVEHIDALERDGGVALVYMHLDSRWLDRETRKMRVPLLERLRYLAAKAGWFVPAGEILDRVRSVEGIRLSCDGARLQLENTNACSVERLVLVSPARQSLVRNGRALQPDASNQIVIDSLGPLETLSFEVR